MRLFVKKHKENAPYCTMTDGAWDIQCCYNGGSDELFAKKTFVSPFCVVTVT